MKPGLALCAAALLAALAGCTGPEGAPAVGAPEAAVSRTAEPGGRFIALVGPRRQHAEPFLGVPGMYLEDIFVHYVQDGAVIPP